MAEILIKATNATHSDPDKDRRGCYKIGMPVVVQPDGHQWGSSEGLPNFVVLKLPGVSVEKVRQFIEPDVIDDGLEEDGITVKRTTYRRRLWRIRVADIPLAARNKFLNNGELTIGNGQDADYSWAQFRQFLKNERTDAEAGANDLD